MTESISKYEAGNILESVVIGGDLSKLSPEQRVMYYKQVCESIGLNPLTRPFDYITLNGKLTLYARKDATDQLRKIHGVSIDDVDITENPTHFIVKVKGHDSTGRSDVEIGVVAKTDMQGNIGNAQMKAVTKGKRRLTLSLCGLGMLDETEVETIPDARPVRVDDAGEIEQPVKTNDAPAPVKEIDQDRKYKLLSGEVVHMVASALGLTNPEAVQALNELKASGKVPAEGIMETYQNAIKK
jgi:hypothetical protein